MTQDRREVGAPAEAGTSPGQRSERTHVADRADGEATDRVLHSWPTLGYLIAASCNRYKHREAIVDGEQRMTYADMGAQISRMIQAFRSIGLVKGDGIAILSHNRLEMVLVIAAAALMGLRFTALRTLGSLDDHAFVLDDAEISALVVDPASFGERAEALMRGGDAAHRTVALGPCGFADNLLELMARHEARLLVDEADPDDICTIAYTGGTTGRPKGVVHTHRTFVAFNMLELMEWEWPSELRFLAATPITHAAISWLLPTFVKGGVFCINKGFSPTQFLKTIERERITMSFAVPTMIYTLLDYPDLHAYDTSSLENIVYGAAPMSPVRLAEAIAAFGPVFSQLYGQTEASTVLTYLPRADHDPANPRRLQSCGFPASGVIIRLLDKDGREVPDGEVGEICARGPHVMREYWKQPEITAEAFAHGWLHTGDLARRDEHGYLFICGRSKDMIITGGFNVYPKEVEDALALHPAVAASAVIGLPDPIWGEKVTAIVVLRDGHAVDADDLAAFVKAKRGSEYAPKRIEFIEEIPVTALGKPDKVALRNRFERALDPLVAAGAVS